MTKISLYEAQQLYFENNITNFRSTLIMLGFKHIKLPHVSKKAHVYIKESYTVQISAKRPVDIRTWNNSSNLQIYCDFKKALRNITDNNF